MNQDFSSQLGQVLNGNTVSQLAGAIGASPQATQQGIQAALPMMLGALTNNAQGGGASALAAALDRDHDGSVLDDLGGFLGSGQAGGIGGAILGHVFGQKQGQAGQVVAQTSGLDLGQATQLLALLAPILMGILGKAKKEGGLNPGALTDLLGQGAQQTRQQAPGGLAGMLTGFLDKDGDGNVLDDLAGGAAGKMLGGLFGKK